MLNKPFGKKDVERKAKITTRKTSKHTNSTKPVFISNLFPNKQKLNQENFNDTVATIQLVFLPGVACVDDVDGVVVVHNHRAGLHKTLLLHALQNKP